MRIKSEFELINVADEYMLVPVGEEAVSFQGVVILSEASARLVKAMKDQKSSDELISILLNEYNVDEKTAIEDVSKFIDKLKDLEVIEY